MTSALAAPPPFQADWKFDTLKLKNGAALQGLVLEEGPKGVRFRIVQPRNHG